MIVKTNATINLPTLDGSIEQFTLKAGSVPRCSVWVRKAYATAHVVADPFPDPELTASRARTVFATHGVET